MSTCKPERALDGPDEFASPIDELEEEQRVKCPGLEKFLFNPIYNGALTLTTMAYSFVLYYLNIDDEYLSLNFTLAIEMPAFILTAIFLIDLIANCIVIGFARIFKERFTLVIEMVL